ncbi:hypothetical protein [Tropicibacter naphthalenivorans]|uniref:Type IV pilus biogenesis protein PilP n=1 Tax=Tropicibacter naphthalenivorans TaxID=441103 RepID=A0A0P1GPF4_9RHOB|nr:hypothetical protein [Tropicibacter naphthalenivorans]CUH76490.1 hypothetical protein TRN7648_00963 [Tropicibacter naphthalenivorans]SMC65817.1 hypothetical protein SAMN04488093_102655 [Tropicibacter naphthalenivorans]
MVPNFALSLSFEGIALLRRMGDKWARIQEIPLDGGDLDAAVIALRDRAESLDPKGSEVVVLIPAEQIRFLDLPDLGGDDIAREVAIRAALDGATPYAVKDLTFDYSLAGGRMLVAAVANETLQEALEFSKSHGFTPVSYAAQAPEGAFAGAVHFGKAKGWRRAAKRLPQAIDIVAADEAALMPVAAEVAPEPVAEPAPEPMPEPAVDTPPAPAADAAPEAEPIAEAAPETPAPDTPEPTDEDAPQLALDLPAQTPEADPAETEEEERQRRRAKRAERKARKQAEEEATAEAALPAADADPVEDAPVVPLAEDEPASLAQTPEPETGAPQQAEVETAAAEDDAKADAAAQTDAPAPDEPQDPADETAEDAPEPEPEETPKPPEPGLVASIPEPPATAPAFPSVAPEPTGTPRVSAPSVKADDAKGTPISITAEDTVSAEGEAPAFASVRATRGTDAIPPAPRPLTLGDGDGAAKPRFTPVLDGASPQAAPAVAKPDTGVPSSDQGDADAQADKGARASVPKAAAGALVGALARGGGVLRTRLNQAKADKAAKAKDKPKAKAKSQPPAERPTAPAVTPPAAPKDVAAKDTAKAPALAARTAEPTPAAPAVKGPSTLSKLAALRAAAPGTPALAAGGAAALDASEAERMTVFGARGQQKVGGKPRFLGLILTATLIMFLIAVAAWASVFLDDGLASLFGGEEPEAVASLPQDAIVVPDALPEAPVTVDNAVELAALETGPAPDTAPPALTVPVDPQTLTPEEAAATYAATGIWQRTPTAPMLPPTDGVDDVYVASIDPKVQELDAVALPDPLDMAQEPRMDDPGLPPPAGMVFDFDNRGLVRATPEGALTPDGLRIFTGLPPVIPPLRNPPLVLPSEDPAQEDAANPLRNLRPEARPDDLLEQLERATLGGISLQELAKIRPVMRPKTAQETAQEAEPDTPATAQAVAQSLKPVPRPRNIAAIVQRAEAQRPAEPVQTAAVAPRTVSPSGPTATTVARAATDNNAINLNKIALIGVYGTPSKRRALVRIPSSGKYQKVTVGDRLDGGRVKAIQEDALIYVKSGRLITLKMPRG